MLRIIITCSCIMLSSATGAETTVKTAALAELAIYPERSAPATVVSLNESLISSRIQAQVTEIPVRVGDIVEQDSVLAKLDCADYRLASKEISASLESLKSQIELANRRLERTRKLTLKQSAAEELLDEREADLSVLQANLRGTKTKLDMAKINESRCTVTSPFRALVLERSSAVGQYANIGTALVKIIDIEQLEISAQIFTDDSDQITQADALYFEHNDRLYPIRLRTISPAINTATRNREARLLFMDGPALPGAAGKLVWKDSRAHIPGEYLVRRDKGLGVFTVKQDKAEFVNIPSAQAGRASPTELPVDTPIVIEGHYSIKHNDTVSVRN